ncbi:hypothetical protein D3C81_1362760 [compost metagenome]
MVIPSTGAGGDRVYGRPVESMRCDSARPGAIETVGQRQTGWMNVGHHNENPAMNGLYIGISGWRYAPWRGLFYPPGLRQQDELRYASASGRRSQVCT